MRAIGFREVQVANTYEDETLIAGQVYMVFFGVGVEIWLEIREIRLVLNRMSVVLKTMRVVTGREYQGGYDYQYAVRRKA